MDYILSKENIFMQYGKNNGLSLLIDTNSDRHFGSLRKKRREEEAVIYIDTLEPLKIVGGGNIALTTVKNVYGDEGYYKYATKKKICQIEKGDSVTEFLSIFQDACKCVPMELSVLDKVILSGSVIN